MVFYNKTTYGINVHKPKRRQCQSLGGKLHYKQPSIANIEGGFFLITSRKQDVLSLYKDTLIVDGSCHKTINDETYHPSGIVILMFCKLQNTKQQKGYKWGLHQANCCKATKENIMDSQSSHHGSTGSYYSVGNRGNYGMNDGSSVAA